MTTPQDDVIIHRELVAASVDRLDQYLRDQARTTLNTALDIPSRLIQEHPLRAAGVIAALGVIVGVVLIPEKLGSAD